jgi:hypothetical protein
MRALVRQTGQRLASCSAESLPARLAQRTLPRALAETLAPLRRMVEAITTELTAIDARLRQAAAHDPGVQRLQRGAGRGAGGGADLSRGHR